MLAALAVAIVATLAAAPALAEVVLHRGNGGEPQTLDPAHASIDAEANILKDLYEGLTARNAAGEVIPGAAESWAVSDDGLTYTFKIRDVARWSNGDPVTADDFVYSFRRIENPEQTAAFPDVLYPIRNAEAINTAKPDSPVPVDTLGVKAVDAKTLEITLQRPTPYFLTLMAHQAALPVHKGEIDKFGAEFVKPGDLVSNGAFMLTENVANDHVTVAKNPNYWDAVNVKLDKVIFYPTNDQADAVRRFATGELDLNYYFPTDQERLLQDKFGNDEVRLSPSLAVYYYAVDERQPPFDDVRVRQALSMAIDRDFLSQSVSSGALLPLYSFVPPGIPGYTPAEADFASIPQPDRQSKARELLKEAGYGDVGKPLNIEMRTNSNDNYTKLVTAIADMWKALGASVAITDTDTKSHYAYLQEGGTFNAAGARWTADYPDPENFLALYVSTNTTFNYGRYDNPKYDDLMKQSYAERDPAKRYQILHDAETLLMSEQGLIPLMAYALPWLVSSKVHGWQDNAVNEHQSRFLTLDR